MTTVPSRCEATRVRRSRACWGGEALEARRDGFDGRRREEVDQGAEPLGVLEVAAQEGPHLGPAARALPDVDEGPHDHLGQFAGRADRLEAGEDLLRLDGDLHRLPEQALLAAEAVG